MSDDEDLFASSDDGENTDDLIASVNSAPVAKKKKLGKAKKASTTAAAAKRIPDADNDDDDDDDDDDNLFDDSDDEKPAKTKKKKRKAKSSVAAGDDDDTSGMTKRQRIELLQKKKRAAISKANSSKKAKSAAAAAGKKKRDKPTAEGATSTTNDGKSDGYESQDSATFERTQADHDFIDSDDDEDALKELYADQHFEDERPEDIAEFEDRDGSGSGRKRGGSRSGSRKRGPDAVSDDEGEGTSNPIMQAVNKMKKKKKAVRKLGELEEEVKALIDRMEAAADDDLDAYKLRKPAVNKIRMLNEVIDYMVRKDTMRLVLDNDMLATLKRWISPLPDRKLGNLTVRSRIIETVATMNGPDGITSYDLKRSEFGKAIMGLYMHPQETPAMKRQMKKLIEVWSRPIFQKSGNMRDLEHAQSNRASASPRRLTPASQSMKSKSSSNSGSGGTVEQELNSMINKGKRLGGSSKKQDMQRVRVPFSKGFNFSVRPKNQSVDPTTTPNSNNANDANNRAHLAKRMLEKSRPASKNNRSANISIEGRKVK